MKEYILKVLPENSNKRIDIFLMDFFKHQDPGVSRTFIQSLIESGNVFLNGEPIKKTHYKVKAEEEIKIIFEDKKRGANKPEDIPLEIIYEDGDIVIINKQIGLVSHPAPGNYEHTLVNALLYKIGDLSDISPDRQGIVHRLDKDTSGLLVAAKNNAAHLNLAKQFAEHTIKRKYIALVSGKMEFDENIIEMPIGRHPIKRKNMAVGFGKNTRYAKTLYRTLKRGDKFSLVELEPFTGRTHQLRVHLAFIGHPILGYKKYGKNNKFKRLALHAKSIGFIHPSSGKYVEFSTDMPEEFKQFLDSGV
ncbi:MAG: RluA family pseudouridine synthase [Candidatus Omnitrophota bacterium]